MLLVKNHEAVKWDSAGQEKANVFDSGILLLSLITAQLAFELSKTSGALHSPKGRSMPRLEGKPHFKRWGMLGVAAMWAQEAQEEQAGNGPSAGYKRHWWIPKEGGNKNIRISIPFR
jgi:hypothetical protein